MTGRVTVRLRYDQRDLVAEGCSAGRIEHWRAQRRQERVGQLPWAGDPTRVIGLHSLEEQIGSIGNGDGPRVDVRCTGIDAETVDAVEQGAAGQRIQDGGSFSRGRDG